MTPDYVALGCNWVAIEAVERLQDRRPSDRQCVPASVVLDPFTNVMNKGHEANKLLTKSDEHDLPTPRCKCFSYVKQGTVRDSVSSITECVAI